MIALGGPGSVENTVLLTSVDSYSFDSYQFAVLHSRPPHAPTTLCGAGRGLSATLKKRM
jgi:hypothetical protein